MPRTVIKPENNSICEACGLTYINHKGFRHQFTMNARKCINCGLLRCEHKDFMCIYTPKR